MGTCRDDERLTAPVPPTWSRLAAMSAVWFSVHQLLAGQSARERALSQFQEGRNIIARLTRQSPENATLPQDPGWFESQIKAQER